MAQGQIQVQAKNIKSQIVHDEDKYFQATHSH